MSLFIGSPAFEHGGFDYEGPVRLGVLAASIIAVSLGYLVLRWSSPGEAGAQQRTRQG